MAVKRINCYVTKPCVKPFPKLMKHTGTGTIAIVSLIGGYYCPTILVQKGPTKVGDRAISYTEEKLEEIYSKWEDYNEPLILQNE